MDEIRTQEWQGDLIMPRLLSAFAGIALLLAIMGVYGVMSHTVAQRTREMGIRLALGAHRGDILRLVLRQGAVLAAFGLGAGVAIAAGVARFLSSFLFGVSPFDVATFAVMTFALGVAALLATLVPAGRATRVDPVTSLRAQ
jgi:ABC-type antimicrobial peptide transport system permease subunit